MGRGLVPIRRLLKFAKLFQELMTEEGYLPEQVFNCDETGFFWKKMPRRAFITAEEKKLPGHKSMKDQLTLALCCNASGDFLFTTSRVPVHARPTSS